MTFDDIHIGDIVKTKKNNKYAIFARKDTARKTCGDLA